MCERSLAEFVEKLANDPEHQRRVEAAKRGDSEGQPEYTAEDLRRIIDSLKEQRGA